MVRAFNLRSSFIALRVRLAFDATTAWCEAHYRYIALFLIANLLAGCTSNGSNPHAVVDGRPGAAW
jgi:hypothetical protein